MQCFQKRKEVAMKRFAKMLVVVMVLSVFVAPSALFAEGKEEVKRQQVVL